MSAYTALGLVFLGSAVLVCLPSVCVWIDAHLRIPRRPR